MFIETMASMLRLYTDEPDQTLESDALVALWLQLAYDDFRSMVAEMDPTIYMVSYDTTATPPTLNLNNVLLGPSPTQPRMDTLIDIVSIEGGQEASTWRAGTNISDVIHGNADYVLAGTTLHFPRNRSSAIRIYYMPTPTINWVAGMVAGSNTYLDDLFRFHDVIPLIAYLQYAVLDAADHPQQLMLLQRRQTQLKNYLSTRGGPAAFEVPDSRWMEP
jgi:hypothetical protein